MRFLLTIMIFLPMLCMAQENLVPNGSFEELTACPTTISQLHLCPPWNNPTGATPDYFNVCGPPDITPPDTFPRMGVPENVFGTQLAKEGDAYAGIYVFLRNQEVRDYIQVELTEPLFYRIPYAVGFYVSVSEKSQYAISTLGAHLSVDAISSTNLLPLNVVPQILPSSQQLMMDTTAWVLITDTIVSQDGGERYLTIGNFSSDAETDTVLFNPQPNNWQLSYYYIDDVSVVALDSVPSGVGINEVEELGFAVYPNPATDVLRYRVLDSSARTSVGMTIRVLDAVGRKVDEQTLKQVQDDRTVDVSGLPPSIYFLELTNQEGRKAVKKFVKE